MKTAHFNMFHSYKGYNTTCFFNGFELFVDWNFSEVAMLMLKVCSTSLYAWGVIGTLEEKICTTGYVPYLN